MGNHLCRPKTGEEQDDYIFDLMSTLGISLSNSVDKTVNAPNVRRQVSDEVLGNNSLILIAGNSFKSRLFVRYFLIYSFYIDRYPNKKDAFESIFYGLVSLTRLAAEQLAKLEQFKVQYEKEQTEELKDLFVARHFFTTNFLSQTINKILLFSNDPKDICHIAFPITRLFNGIKRQYRSSDKMKNLNQAFIIAKLSKSEKNIISKMVNKECCFSFSTFMRGFTVEGLARKKFNEMVKENQQNKSQQFIVLFTINFPYDAAKMESDFDYGIFISQEESAKTQGNIVFNIKNTFKVASKFSPSQFDLDYGYLPFHYYKRYIERNGMDNSTIHIFNICNAISSNYLKSQSCLLRILKSDDSITVSKDIISIANTQQSNALQKVITEVEVENMINHYIDVQNYKMALELAEEYISFPLIEAKKLEILYKDKQYDRAKQWLLKIDTKNLNKARNLKITQREEIIEFIAAKLILLGGNKSKAGQKLKILLNRMYEKYDKNLDVIGVQVINALEELEISLPGHLQDISKSQVLIREAIKQSQINIRGISTTI